MFRDVDAADHDAGRDHVASRVSRDAGLAEGRSDRAARPADHPLPLGRKPAARIRSPVSRCRRGRRSTRTISARCSRPTTRRSAPSSGAFADAIKSGRGAHHLAGRDRPALPRRRSAREPPGRRCIGGARGAGQGADRQGNRASGRRRPRRAARGDRRRRDRVSAVAVGRASGRGPEAALFERAASSR